MNIIPFTAPIASGLNIDLNKKKIDKIALIDADRYKHVVTYRIYQKLMDEGELHNTQILNDTIDEYLSHDIFNRFDADAYIFCFSAPSKNVFRHSIAQTKRYKGNRDGKKDPYFYSEKYDDMAYIYEYINSRYSTLFFDDLEADDILCMLQREETFIFSHDKDLKQVAGWHWDMDNYKLINITEQQAFTNLIGQLLLGDSTDNISGLKGFGKKAFEDFKLQMKSESLKPDEMLIYAIQLYTDKYGVLNGFDTFVEMWSLVSLKINRGEYLQNKYATAFYMIDGLCKKQENGTELNGQT